MKAIDTHLEDNVLRSQVQEKILTQLFGRSEPMAGNRVVLLRRWEPPGIPPISWTWLFPVAVVTILVLLVGYPVGLIFIRSFAESRPGQASVWGFGAWIAAFNDSNLPLALGNTLFLALLRIIITTILAIFFAWVVTRTDTPFKGLIEVIL